MNTSTGCGVWDLLVDLQGGIARDQSVGSARGITQLGGIHHVIGHILQMLITSFSDTGGRPASVLSCL